MRINWLLIVSSYTSVSNNSTLVSQLQWIKNPLFCKLKVAIGVAILTIFQVCICFFLIKWWQKQTENINDKCTKGLNPCFAYKMLFRLRDNPKQMDIEYTWPYYIQYRLLYFANSFRIFIVKFGTFNARWSHHDTKYF